MKYRVSETKMTWLAGKGAQQVNVPVPEGCTDPAAQNFDPTARSDDGTCVYNFWAIFSLIWCFTIIVSFVFFALYEIVDWVYFVLFNEHVQTSVI